MQITKEVLQLRLAGMEPQLGRLLEEAAMVRGAINLCNELMAYLQTAEAVKPPDPPEPPEPPELEAGQAPGDLQIEE